ncbi:MAG: DUF1761 domain-containing protein [Chlamydiia bacterium]|nr:DUF1761 domain-containing protein [Chlamydiia bacterium]
MDAIQIDWIVIVIAAVLSVAIGFIWYSKWLFGKTWMKLVGLKEKDLKGNKRAFIGSWVVAFLTAFFLERLESNLGVTTVSDGMFVGFCVWLGFVATTQISSVIWGQKPWKLFFINTGCKLVLFLVMSGVIAA